jgi:BASS family bile acid:Na+ symporter
MDRIYELLDYKALEYALASTQCMLLMFGMGVTLRLRDFLDVFREPTSFLLGMLGLLAVGPLFAWIFIESIGLAAPLALGLYLVAVMPGGSVSNVFTFFGRGNVPLSISLTAVMTVTSIVTVPILLPWLSGGLVPDDFAMPTLTVLREVFLWLILPVVAGMAFGKRFPNLQKATTWFCLLAGFAIVVGIALGSTGSGELKPLQYGFWPIAMIAAFLLITQQVSMLPYRFLGLPTADRLATGIEVSVRNINLGLLLKASLFPAGTASEMGSGVLFVLLVYGGTSIVICIPTMAIYRQLIVRDESRRAADRAAVLGGPVPEPHTGTTQPTESVTTSS